ncbi:hypothetical protein [Phenylobacterium sp.]|jgi:hypothetical protein|uniref:hypothetical protein n=1 Tax=Phenylobacterium sp. TaxID=1871053 RepID=UPI002E30E142|nr:hypothetical protein [Phenylobacterium sp.]HEX4713252.1 hypothetical protein [Phenylobacterium sp.]
MYRTLTLLAAAAFALSLVGAADAAACKDAEGKFTKCPSDEASATYTLDAKGNCRDANGKMAKMTMCSVNPPAPALESKGAMESAPPMATAGSPNCKKGKRCGNTCISVKDICLR